MVGEGNKLYCKECGNGVEIDEYYDFHYLHEGDTAPISPSAWVDWERTQVIKEIRADENYSFSCECDIGELPKYKYLKDPNTTVECGEGTITIDHTGLSFVGKKYDEDFTFHLDYKTLFSLVIVTDCTFFSLYVNGKYYEFHPERPSVIKALLITEEMHRMHVNKWKNLPWMNHIYE